MSCQDFEFVSIELARGSLIDTAAREAARSHAAACASCAARLRRERALSSALREVGATMRQTEAPARVEAALLAVMRERRAAATGNAVAVSQEASHREVVKVSRRESVAVPRFASLRFAPRARRAFFAAAVAASLLVVLGVAWRALSQRSQVERVADGATAAKKGESVESANSDQNVESARRVESVKKDEREQATTPRAIERDGATGRMSIARGASHRRVRGEVETLPITFEEDGGRVTPDDGAAVASPVSTSAAEIAASSDFVPLFAADGATPLDSGQMVRVQVSRAALAALGLPVNASRAGESVKADVLLAHDGTARAIRLLP